MENPRRELSYQKTGYLDEKFKLFYIIDQEQKTLEYHYHDFHKILIFLQGNVSYVIEGKQYDLKPFDIILVRAGEIHRPVIHDTSAYERIIAYISPAFFEECRKEGNDLYQCFARSQAQQAGLIRPAGQPSSPAQNLPGRQAPSAAPASSLIQVCHALASGFSDNQFACGLYRKIKFMEFRILINRIVMEDTFSYKEAMTSNPSFQSILKYINDHLTEDTLSIDTISQAAFLNRSYLMHLFKEETGYTIGKYISEKRLFLARSHILNGIPVTEACYRSGFKNYTSFYYAYKNKYGSAPTKI